MNVWRLGKTGGTKLVQAWCDDKTETSPQMRCIHDTCASTGTRCIERKVQLQSRCNSRARRKYDLCLRR